MIYLSETDRGTFSFFIYPKPLLAVGPFGVEPTRSRQLVIQVGAGGDVVPVHSTIVKVARARVIHCQAEVM